jgi:hypothetical protein
VDPLLEPPGVRAARDPAGARCRDLEDGLVPARLDRTPIGTVQHKVRDLNIQQPNARRYEQIAPGVAPKDRRATWRHPLDVFSAEAQHGLDVTPLLGLDPCVLKTPNRKLVSFAQHFVLNPSTDERLYLSGHTVLPVNISQSHLSLPTATTVLLANP